MSALNDAELERALWDFVKSVSPDAKAARVADEVCQLVASAAKEALDLPVDDCSLPVDLFGSSANGFGEGTADLDFTVDCSAHPGAENLLRNMHKALIAKPAAQRRLRVKQYVHKARVPVLNLMDSDSDRMVDVTVNNRLAVHNARLLKAYADSDARCRSLVLVIKRYVKSKGVSGAAHGYLSSYAFALLVIFYLQVIAVDKGDFTLPLPSLQALATGPDMFEENGREFDVSFARGDAPFLYQRRSREDGLAQSLVSLVKGFFVFYTSTFDWSKDVVSVRLGLQSKFGSAEVCELASSKTISIEDPFDHCRNLGAALTQGNAAMLQSVFREAATMLASDRGARDFLDQLHWPDAIDVDLRSPVSLDTLHANDSLCHFRVRPQKSNSDIPCSFSFPDILKFQHELDDYQKRAIWAIEQNECMVLSAPTSAGKTAVAEYAIAKALQQGNLVVFCSPVKALSNQKYAELAQRFPGQVGLLTGDVATETKTNIRVVTTEVLGLMLREDPQSFEKLAIVIFDEVHFLGDHERGVAWEETMILLPVQTLVVCLSATAPNIIDIAGWISQIRHMPCHALCSTWRPVPLQHFVCVGGGQRHLVLDENRTFHKENYQALQSALSDATECSSDAAWGVLKEQLAVGQQILPMLVFSFSKRECNAHATAFADACPGGKQPCIIQLIASFLSPAEGKLRALHLKHLLQQTHNSPFLTTEQTEEVMKRAHRVVSSLDKADQNLPQIGIFLSSLLPRGISIHHAGILPCLRELTEMLLKDGLLGALFCTETCGLGLNLPVRSVLFTFKKGKELSKWDGMKRRLLLPSEYTQMSGRAGRRGKDATGTIVVCLDSKLDEGSFVRVVLKPPEAIESAFSLNCSIILSLLRFGHLGYLQWFVRQSFRQFQSQHALQQSTLTDEIIPKLMSLRVLKFVSNDFTLARKGKAACSFSMGNELLLCELIAEDLLSEAQPVQILAFLSRFAADASEKQSDKENRSDSKDDSKNEWLETLLQKASSIAGALDDTFASHGVRSGLQKALEKKQGFEDAVLCWLGGATFGDALRAAPGLDPGAFVNLIRRLEKLSQQVLNAALILKKTESILNFESGLKFLKRGLPFKDSLYVGEVAAIHNWQSMSSAEREHDVIGVAETEPAGSEQEKVSVGSKIMLSPYDIGFYHNSISESFSDGQSIRERVLSLLKGSLQVGTLRQLRVHWHNGKFFTLSNRTLAALRLFCQFKPNQDGEFTIPALVVSYDDALSWGFNSRFTAGRWGGSFVRIRETGELIGHSKLQTSFRLEMDPLPTSTGSDIQYPMKIAYWQTLENSIRHSKHHLSDLSTFGEDADPEKFRGSYELSRGADPASIPPEKLARMNLNWSPCKDPKCMQPECSNKNGTPCTRKTCRGIFEKTGEPCQMCHSHSPRTLKKYEAFRGFARKAKQCGMETTSSNTGKGKGKNTSKSKGKDAGKQVRGGKDRQK